MKQWSTAVFVLVASVAVLLVVVPAIWLAGMLTGGGLEVEWAILPVMMLLAVLSFGGIARAGTRLCLRAGLSAAPSALIGASGPLVGLVVGCGYWSSTYALVEWWPVSVTAVVASAAGAALASRRRQVAVDTRRS